MKKQKVDFKELERLKDIKKKAITHNSIVLKKEHESCE